jgi:hypothetical protein
MEQIDMLFDPVFAADQYYEEIKQTNQIVDAVHRLDMNSAYAAIASTLWNSGMPCSDLDSANNNNVLSVLKYCQWKGRKIPCSHIFSPYPTDQGMCCTFNIKAAEQVFAGELFSQLIENLQNMKGSLEMDPSVISYSTEPGKNNGLLVVLDSHSDMLSASSLDSNTQGFIGLISPTGSFPQINLGGFDIKPGHKNTIAISPTKIMADDQLQNIDAVERNCYFEWENTSLQIFQSYSQSNCIFECHFFFAQDITLNKFPQCSPWYFPTSEYSPKMCDPWMARNMSEYMSNVPKKSCRYFQKYEKDSNPPNF